jgi:hypothetical protein
LGFVRRQFAGGIHHRFGDGFKGIAGEHGGLRWVGTKDYVHNVLARNLRYVTTLGVGAPVNPQSGQGGVYIALHFDINLTRPASTLWRMLNARQKERPT